MFQCKYCDHSFTTHNHKIMHENGCPYKGAKLGYKFCKVCGNEIQLKNFNVCNARFDNLNGQCKECTKAYHKSWINNILLGLNN